MPRIPEEEIERIKAEVDLVALIRSRGIELKKHGSRDLVGRCPFHEDKTASLIVSPQKRLFHCMGCGKAGNSIQFVGWHDGLSFRHAFEVLANGGNKAFQAGEVVKKGTVRKLESWVGLEADEETATGQALEYYRERLGKTPEAQEYLKKRGISPEAIEYFKVGFADRTLGFRLPSVERKAGAEIRARLKKIGLLREKTGHEHFNGCVVFPIADAQGRIREVYGRKIRDDLREGTAYHLYLPGPHVGIFNGEALKQSREIILCEAIMDALSFWCAGLRNVTTIYGTEGFTEELKLAFLSQKTRRVWLAYDCDPAGDRAAERDGQWFQSKGIEVLRIKFPAGMDANEYARKVTPPEQSLRLLVNSAEWIGRGAAPNPSPEPSVPPAALEAPSSESLAPAPASSSLAALLAADEKQAAKEKKPSGNSSSSPSAPCETLEAKGEDLHLSLEGRSYRVRGLEKNGGMESLRINLRLLAGELYYVNVLDLYQARQRQQFIEEASKETLLDPELIKRDLGRLLLKLETLQEERLTAAVETQPREKTMNAEEKAEAMEFLKSKNLMERIVEVLGKSGLVGERKNALAAYLAGTSRKLDRPLAIIIQSTSAAGKSTLMDAVLSLFPEEERIKYSAMTGQSLYYLGAKDLKHKILAIVEEEGAEKAGYALKLLQSEGELRIAATGKDPATGRMTTQEYRVEGPVMIILTTTAVEIDEELHNRALVLTVDESREQTARIQQLQRKARTLEGLAEREERKRLVKVLKNAQRLIEPVGVVNPYAGELTFTSERTRNRRDHEKYLTMIDVIALLHQHQRERKRLPNGTAYVEVELGDIELANQLAPELFMRSLDELPPQTRRLLEAIKTLVREKSQGGKLGQKHLLFSRRELKLRVGWSMTSVRNHLERLRELEYVATRLGKNGALMEYELLVNCNEAEGVVSIGLIDVEELRRRKGGR